jgi:hypothetical protein
MSPELLDLLRARSGSIRDRWEALLRIERVNTPLANPDALVHLIPGTMIEIFKAAAKPPRAPLALTEVRADRLPACECGHNPYLAYFLAGEQALVEALVLLQTELPPAQRTESDVAELIRAIRRLGREEIDAFCGICVHRGCAKKCRHAAACAS